MDPGPREPAQLQVAVARKRYGRWLRTNSDPCSDWHGLRASCRLARHQRAVRHNSSAHCICDFWPESCPRVGTRFVARRVDCRHNTTTCGWKRRSGNVARWCACHSFWRALHRGRFKSVWLCHGAALQTHPLRLHERHRANRADWSATHGPGLLGERRRYPAASDCSRIRNFGRQDKLDGRCRQFILSRCDFGMQALGNQASRSIDCRGRRNCRRLAIGPRRARAVCR